MRKQSPPANKREAREAKRRARQRRLWAVGAAALVLVAAVAVIVYFAVRDEVGTPEVKELVTQDLVEGTGEAAQAGDLLSVYYTLWLEDGTKVQSNVGGSPYEFTLGAGGVIKGWDQGLAGMKVGGTRQLTIPPDLAYGAAGNSSSIPPNATLTFEVELVAIE
jgi:FKBP-type peptidyl-prolyl cis-trans isomerase FkpA